MMAVRKINEDVLDVLRKYYCRILFTIRRRYEKHMRHWRLKNVSETLSWSL